MANAKQKKADTVSMTFRKPWRRYSQGDRAGFPEEQAKQLEARKIAIPTSEATKAGAGSGRGKKQDDKGTEGADKV